MSFGEILQYQVGDNDHRQKYTGKHIMSTKKTTHNKGIRKLTKGCDFRPNCYLHISETR